MAKNDPKPVQVELAAPAMEVSPVVSPLEELRTLRRLHGDACFCIPCNEAREKLARAGA